MLMCFLNKKLPGINPAVFSPIDYSLFSIFDQPACCLAGCILSGN